MPDSDATAEQDSAAGHDVGPELADAIQQTEAYETDEGVVFYDAENPLAWMQAAEVLDLQELA